jgi:hypothetical protein
MRKSIIILILLILFPIYVYAQPPDKGALIVKTGPGTTATTTTWLPIGTDGQVLTVDSLTPIGIKWNTPTSSGPGASLPSGAIFFITSGTCPAGTIEASDLNGKTLFGTVVANSDVGTIGGNDNITPTGLNSAPAFIGDSVISSGTSGGTPSGTLSWPIGVPAFTGNAFTSIINHIHPITLSLLGGATDDTTAPFPGIDASTLVTTAITGSSATSDNPSGGVSSITPSGTIAWPIGVPIFTGGTLSNHTHTTTATGSVSAPLFTGTQFDNRSAYIKVIFCRVN